MIDETRLEGIYIAPPPMDRSVLAGLMLQWEEQKKKLDDLSIIISDAVLDLGESVTNGNIKAKYSKGRNSYNYETPCKLDPRYADEVDNFTTEIAERIIPADFSIDYKALAKMLGLDPLITKPGVPSVKVQMID